MCCKEKRWKEAGNRRREDCRGTGILD
jgi:hypothetical protein